MKNCRFNTRRSILKLVRRIDLIVSRSLFHIIIIIYVSKTGIIKFNSETKKKDDNKIRVMPKRKKCQV